jgi:phosphohistidine phosphatase
MKSLFLIRHGKSDWEDAKVRDFDRPLSERGHQDAIAMASFLKTQNINPTFFISSPALRAHTTCKHFAEAFDYPAAMILLRQEIYEAVPDDLYKIIQSIDNQYDTVLMFGHNPSISYIADHFLSDYIPEVPTCGVVQFSLEQGGWSSFSPKTAKFVAMWEPKQNLSVV